MLRPTASCTWYCTNTPLRDEILLLTKRRSARNLLLLTLLVDDSEGLNDVAHWNIYYHLFLDERCLQRLQSQARKLLSLSTSIELWHASEYGSAFRFCDQVTLAVIRKMWQVYSFAGLSDEDKANYRTHFKSSINNAIESKADYTGKGLVCTAVRSAAPLCVQSMIDLPGLYQSYWDHGTTDKTGHRNLSKTRLPNPMFSSLITDTLTLHYGTDPLLGFHLATAYAPLVSGSSLRPETSGKSHVHKVVEAARLHFQSWTCSFRRGYARKSLKVRFVTGEGLAFCHTLQRQRIDNNHIPANWYRAPYHLGPLILDGEDYRSTGDAPFQFDVIDTSNLLDDVGALNLLVASSSLLKRSLSATLYTESFVKLEKSRSLWIENVLCGDFATVSILLGLFPVEYWTNATAVSSGEEDLLDGVMSHVTNIQSGKKQMYIRLTWKRIGAASEGTAPQSMASPNIQFEETDLAHILHCVYQKMFRNENIAELLSGLDLMIIQRNSLVHYHRGSLAAFLRMVKRNVTVPDWSRTMDIFLTLIKNDSIIIMGLNYIQELYLHMHLLGVHSVSTLSPTSGNPTGAKGLAAWKIIPEFVCIILKVPRAKLKVITDLPRQRLGTPIVQCVLQTLPTARTIGWQNIFAVVHLAFGKITTSGSRSSEDFQVHVAEDEQGWRGSSPLFVSFLAPTWPILSDPENVAIALGIQTTPQSTITFAHLLGYDMNLFKTSLGNENNVFITKNRPNHSGIASVCEWADADTGDYDSSDSAACTTMKAMVDQKTARVVGFTGRIDFLSSEVKGILSNQARIKTFQVSPCITDVVIGENPISYTLHFPVPVPISQSKTRIARKSSYVEIVVPLINPLEGQGFPHFMYPLHLNGQSPVIWNMPHLNLECLPQLDLKKTKDMQWLITHTSLMFSAREQKLREQSMASSTNMRKDLRTNFKDSLFSIYMHFSGQQGTIARTFGINNAKNGGIHIIFFVSSLRLDLANHTVVLDMAVLPLVDRLMPKLGQFLAVLRDSICSIVVNDEELLLWKEILPAFVERCRQWEHFANCEYLIKSKIPLSVEKGQSPICSCGNGKLPADFISGIPGWDNKISKHLTRAAISPTFSAPFVEQIFEGDDMKQQAGKQDLCYVCGRKESRDGAKLRKCGKCCRRTYCSVQCQRADWKDHKKSCS